MKETKVHFIGFLANVDDTILGLKLGDDFVVEKLSQKEVVPFLKRIEFHYGASGYPEIFTQGASPKCYCIRNDNIANFQKTEQNGVVIKIAECENYLNNLKKKVRLLRLFQGGNILFRFSCFYHIKNTEPSVFRIVRQWIIKDRTIFTLGAAECSMAEQFIKSTKLPFTQSFLQLAFECFELSYDAPNFGLLFLSLMMSLETMLNVDRYELRYRTSRNTAVLLGKSFRESEKIFKEVRGLYDKRSKLVHTGKQNAITINDVFKLRNYVRESIKEISTINKGKDKLVAMLNSSGFEKKIGLENRSEVNKEGKVLKKKKVAKKKTIKKKAKKLT